MPRPSCNACCQPGQLARNVDSYRAASLTILCAILEAVGGSTSVTNIRYDWEVLCDPGDGTPVFVRWEYTTDGTVAGTSAYLADGTPYGGAIEDLVACSGGGGNGTSVIVDGVDDSIRATVLDLTNSNPLTVGIVDANGDLITSFGGGVQYVEAVAAAANPTGTAQILIADSTPALEVAEGENVARRGTRYGAAYTQIVSSTGTFIDTFGGGVQYLEGTVEAAITGTAAMMETAGDVLEPIQGSVAGGLLVDLGANNDVTVTGTVAVTQSTSPWVISGTVDTEFPAAALLADNTATPTTTSVAAFGMVFDGATWDFMRGTAADGVLVNLGANNDVTVTGSVSITGNVTVDQGTSPWVISGTVDTELPPAALLTDNFANPTAPAVGAFGMIWDGAAWDRMPGNATDGVTVNLGTNNDVIFLNTVDTGNISTNTTIDFVVPDGTGTLVWWMAGDMNSNANFIFSMSQNGTDFEPLEGFAIQQQVITQSSGDAKSAIADNPFYFKIQAALFFRVQVTGVTSGSVDYVVSQSYPPTVFICEQLGIPHVDLDGSDPWRTADIWAYGYGFNGTNWDRARTVVDGTNSVGTGIMASGLLAQFDNTTITAITDGRFGNLRISANRNLYQTIRDAAGNERGANVNASNQLSVSVDAPFPAAAALSDNFANPTTTSVASMNMLWDGATWDRAPGNSTDGMLVNLGANNDVTVTGTVDITELPAAAALSDNFANPTTTQVGAMGMLWDGATWDRFPGNSTDGALVNLGANNDVVQATASNFNAQVVGNIAHDSADSGNPVKTGGKAFDLTPTTTAVEPGPTNVTANDRADTMVGLKGESTEHPLGLFVTLTALNIDYDTTSTESATSDPVNCFKYREATVGLTIDSTGTSTHDIQIVVEVSLDGTNYFELKNGALGQWLYDDTYTATAKSVAYTFPIACQKIRVRIDATGLLAATNFFTVTNACLYLRN